MKFYFEILINSVEFLLFIKILLKFVKDLNNTHKESLTLF